MRECASLGAALIVPVAPSQAGTVEDRMQSEDLDLAISNCTAEIESGELQGHELAEAYRNRGFAYGDLTDYRRAIADYDTALRLDPRDANTYNNRGLAYSNLGEHRRAIEDYDKALRRQPGSIFAFNNRGNAYRQLGECARAIEDYNRSLRLDPDVAGAYNNRGLA
jgi:tetratricopeptide (TPR) repeat protein